MTFRFCVPTLLCLAAVLPATGQEKKSPFERWEKSVVAIEKRLKANPPAKGAIFFAGSSSIVRWDLEKSFPGQAVVKVGFGGSQIADSAHFAARLFHPWQPAVVVFYAGDNDVASGKSPQTVHQHFRDFVKAVHAGSPKTKILFLSIKPSTARWKLWKKMGEANALIAAECEKDARLGFVDVGKGMLDADGKPRPELFVKDGLHLSPAGYRLWTDVVRNHLSARK